MKKEKEDYMVIKGLTKNPINIDLALIFMGFLLVSLLIFEYFDTVFDRVQLRHIHRHAVYCGFTQSYIQQLEYYGKTDEKEGPILTWHEYDCSNLYIQLGWWKSIPV